MNPVDIYVRVSRVGKREHLMSPDDQERSARAYADSLGLKCGEVIRDIDQSGGKLDRPGLMKAIGRVESAKSAGLIVAYFDRFSRDVEQGLAILKRLEDGGGKLYAPNMPTDFRTAEGEFQIGLFLLIAQRERKLRSEGLERAKENAIRQGVPVATRPAVGYQQREDRRLEPNPRTAPVVAEVFAKRAAGAGPTELAKFLESNGVTTSQGSETWTKQAVAGLIKSRIYLGELSYGKDLRYVNQDSHEAIVDLATWTAAQHPNGKQVQAPRSAGLYSLTGIIRCANCGYSLQGTKSSHGHRIYRCVGRHAGGECPKRLRISAETVEQMAESAFWAVTGDLSATGNQEGPTTKSLNEALRRAESRLAQALTPEVQDAAAEGWPAMIQARKVERDKAAKELGDAQAARPMPSLETLRELWESASQGDKRELMAVRFDCIALTEDGLIVFAAGSGPDNLSRRGFRAKPGLHPIHADGNARVLSL